MPWMLKSNFFREGPTASLSADWLNTVANILNDLDGDGCHIEKPANGGWGWKIIVDKDTNDSFRWKTEPADVGPGIRAIRVYKGAWTRKGTLTSGGDLVELWDCDPGQEYKTITACGPDDYICAVLQRASSDKDPGLYPDRVTAVNYASAQEDTGVTGKVFVLGRFVSGTYERIWNGGDIDDQITLCDSNSIMGAGLFRRTLQENPQSTDHEREAQLYDVHNVKQDAWSIPYFHADNVANIQGSLLWAAIDSYDTEAAPVQETLQVLTPGTGTGRLQIWNFHNALDQQMLTAEKWGAPPSFVGYHYPVTEQDEPYLSGDGSGPGAAGTFEGEILSGSMSGSITGDTLTINYASRTLQIGDGRANFAAEVGTSFDVDLSGWTPTVPWNPDWCSSIEDCDWFGEWATRHDELDDMPSATNADHDSRYWPCATYASPDTKNYETSGYCEASELAIYGSAGAQTWSAANFQVDTGYIGLNSSSYISLDCAGNFNMDGNAGRTVVVNGTDPATGLPVSLEFHKGILIV